MTSVSRLKRWLRWLPDGRERLRTEISDELHEHIEQLTRDNIDSGMKPDEARRAAVLRFGNASDISDRCQQERQVFRFEELVNDVRLDCAC